MKIVAFGASTAFLRFAPLVRKEVQIVAVVDNDEKKHGINVGSHRILSPAVVANIHYDNVVLFSTYAEQITKQLLEMGIPSDKIITPPQLSGSIELGSWIDIFEITDSVELFISPNLTRHLAIRQLTQIYGLQELGIRILQLSFTKIILHNGLGGGSELFLIDHINSYDDDVLIIVPKVTFTVFLHRANRSERNGAFIITQNIQYEDILNCVCSNRAISEVLINQLYDLEIGKISSVLVNREEPLKLVLHDYQYICDSYNLLQNDGSYCNANTDIRACKNCQTKRWNSFYERSTPEIEKFRSQMECFLSHAVELIAPSQACKQIYLKYYPSLEITVKEHSKYLPTTLIERTKTSFKYVAKLDFAFVGNLNPSKGFHILDEFCSNLPQNPFLRLNVFGESTAWAKRLRENHSFVLLHGPYERSELLSKLIESHIDGFLFTSVWPETYSYVIREIAELNKPVFSFNLGAQAEFLRGYENGEIVEDISGRSLYSAVVNFYKSANYNFEIEERLKR